MPRYNPLSFLDFEISDDASRALARVDLVDLPLNILTPEINEIGSIIEDIRANRVASSVVEPQREVSGLHALAESIYCFRQKRDEIFGGRVFADPRWDILLGLFIAGEQGKRMSVSSALMSALCPATTALRHLSFMVGSGLVRRINHKMDVRVVWVELSDEARGKVTVVLQSWFDDD